MSISIVIPVHNEAKNIATIVTEVNKFLGINGLKGEIIVVNDRSTDKTREALEIIAKKVKNLRAIHRKGDPKSVEVGFATREGILAAKYDIITVMMGDLSDDPNDIYKMIKKIEAGYDVVCGSRFIEGSTLVGYPPLKYVMTRLYNTVFSFLFNLKLQDFSNAFKTYRKEIFSNIKLESKEFEITAEVLLKAHIRGYKITEVPVKWYNRSSGESKLGSFLFSPSFLLIKLPRIGFRYGVLTLKLYLIYLVKVLTGMIIL